MSRRKGLESSKQNYLNNLSWPARNRKWRAEENLISNVQRAIRVNVVLIFVSGAACFFSSDCIGMVLCERKR